MVGAFRQSLGIPDDMLPDAWRRTIDDRMGVVPDPIVDDVCSRSTSNYLQQPVVQEAPVPPVDTRFARYRRSYIRGL